MTRSRCWSAQIPGGLLNQSLVRPMLVELAETNKLTNRRLQKLMNAYTPEHEYTCDEFVDDFDHFVRSQKEMDGKMLIQYFGLKYSNNSEACYKYNRFILAYKFLLGNYEGLEKFVFAGTSGKALVSKPVVIGLWRYFGAIPREHLNEAPTIDLILQLSNEER